MFVRKTKRGGQKIYGSLDMRTFCTSAESAVVSDNGFDPSFFVFNKEEV